MMGSQPRVDNAALAWVGLVLASLFWAGNALIVRAFHEAIPPMSLAFWRWVLALSLLLPIVAVPVWRQRMLFLAARWQLLVLAALAIAGYHGARKTLAFTPRMNSAGREAALLVILT